MIPVGYGSIIMVQIGLEGEKTDKCKVICCKSSASTHVKPEQCESSNFLTLLYLSQTNPRAAVKLLLLTFVSTLSGLRIHLALSL